MLWPTKRTRSLLIGIRGTTVPTATRPIKNQANADETDVVIDFLDTLRDKLLKHYWDAIIDMRTRELTARDPNQTELDLDDDIEF